MKHLIVVVAVLFSGACSLLVDFDAQCNMDTPDCRMDVCKSAPACAPQRCSRDIMYFDSPPASDCGQNEKCIVFENEIGCWPSGLFPDDDDLFYRKCSSEMLGDCPYGSICLKSKEITNGNAFCLPYCNLDTHPNCPNGGTCVSARSAESDFDICLLEQECNSVEGSGCKQKDMSCYMFPISQEKMITFCTIPGTVDTYGICEMPWDCAPGHLCIPEQTGGTLSHCMKLCDSKHFCRNEETCIMYLGTIGICVPNVNPVSTKVAFSPKI